MKKYDIAAFIWPAYTGDEPRTRIFWPEKMGEWQSVKNAVAKTPEHDWPRKPLWGYVNEADPYVMEMEIEAAVDHNVNVFIYDWYWYDNRPFLENCLNDGFLKAKNNNKMKFYLMWANHDANTLWDKRVAGTDGESVLWQGSANREQFETVARRITEKYFTSDLYYTIDGKPVFMIYDLYNFVNGLGGLEKAKDALNFWRELAKSYGLPGVHFQAVAFGLSVANVSGVDSGKKLTYTDMETIGFDSITHYQFVHFTNMNRDYLEILEDVKKEWKTIEENCKLPYYPHVSIGWDNNPRYHKYLNNITKNNPPEQFEKALEMAKEFSDKNNDVPLITINSWNEWTETSYLEPDDLHGYGYLEAIKKVFG